MIKLLLLLCYILSDGIIRAQSPEVESGNVWEKAGKIEGDILLEDKEETIAARNLKKNVLWPGGIVPYTVDKDIDDTGLAIINEAMRRIQNAVNILARREKVLGERCQIIFRHRTDDDFDFLKIVKSPNDYECTSYVGRLRRGGSQKLQLGPGCFTVSTVTHELLHTLGFPHEQSSPKRDDYVTIHKENIDPGYDKEFNRRNLWKQLRDYSRGYDYNSIMHYSGYAFARRGPDGNFVGPTITNKRYPKRTIEVRSRLSSKDKQELRYMYCPKIFYNHPDEDYGTDGD